MTQSINKKTNAPGKVYLVGAGPGAVDLITVRGAKLLEKAGIVFYDALVDPEMLTLCPQAIQVEVGKRCGKLSSAQQFINKRLIDAAQKHQVIVRLKGVTGQPISNPSADTLVYYMGRKDAAKIAQQLIEQSPNQNANTPVQILEAVSTPRERLWTSTLEELAAGKADQWFDSSSPALIMIGEALREKAQRAENLERPSSEVDNRLQDGQVLTNGRRRA